MSQSLTQNYLHIVFSTKNREPLLSDPIIRNDIHAYLIGTCTGQASPSICVGGVEDHVHILCRLAKTLPVSDLIRELKRDSSKWVKEQSPRLASFYWQSGYGAFSVSPGHVESLKSYIADQEEHHKTTTFQDEYRRLLELYELEYDEKYVFEHDPRSVLEPA